MNEDMVKGEDLFFRKVVDKAVVEGALPSAIELADMVFSLGANDFLIRGFVETTEDCSTSWKYIVRLS